MHPGGPRLRGEVHHNTHIIMQYSCLGHNTPTAHTQSLTFSHMYKQTCRTYNTAATRTAHTAHNTQHTADTADTQIGETPHTHHSK